MSRYQKGKTNLDFTEARDSEWQWHQQGHMQICTPLQTNNHASTPPLSFLQAWCPSCLQTNSIKAPKAWCVVHTSELFTNINHTATTNEIYYQLHKRFIDKFSTINTIRHEWVLVHQWLTKRDGCLPVLLNTSQNGVQQKFCVWNIYCTNSNNTVYSLNAPADDISKHLLYRNVLDTDCKHTASRLHVDMSATSDHDVKWISSDNRHTWTKYLHCVTSADVASTDHAIWKYLSSVYMSMALHQCEYEHETSVCHSL